MSRNRQDRPTMLGDGERRFLTRNEDEDRQDRPNILGPTDDKRARRSEDLARRATGHLEKLPGAMASGTATFSTSETEQSEAVTFPTNRFDVPPRVVVTSSDTRVNAAATTVTASGFTVRGRRVSGTGTITDVVYNWVAVAAPATE